VARGSGLSGRADSRPASESVPHRLEGEIRSLELVSYDGDYRPVWAAKYLVLPEVLNALGIVGDMERAEFLVRTPNGEERTLTLAPMPENLGVSKHENDSDGITRARDLDGIEAPLYLLDPLDRLGYGLVDAGKLSEAIEVFELNVAEHPDSWVLHDTLGQALATTGEKQPAIASFEKALALYPSSYSSIKMLERLCGTAD
jgi:tetratricopeptide (TPR) repeat protein